MQKTNVFNRAIYENSQKEVSELIKETLPNWRTTEGFILDGIRNKDCYEKQSLKILVLLGESYGYDECNDRVTIEDELALKDLRIKTLNKIGALLWLIFESLKEGKEFTQKEYPNLFTEYSKIKEALLKIAWVNVKKASNPLSYRQDPSEIYIQAKKNKLILQKQIESIAPDLIIACSDPVFYSLYDEKLLGNGLVRNKKYAIQVNEAGQKIIHVSHPSYFRHWGYNGLFKTYKTIYHSLI